MIIETTFVTVVSTYSQDQFNRLINAQPRQYRLAVNILAAELFVLLTLWIKAVVSLSERAERQVIVEAHDKNSPAFNIPSRRSTNKLRTAPTTDSFAVAAEVNN